MTAMRLLKTSLALFAWLIFQPPAGMCQLAAPTFAIALRVLMVESQYGRGTIFSIDVDQREYWITAKHNLTGVKRGPPYGSIEDKSVSLRLLNAAAKTNELQWLPVNFSIIDPGREDIDVVILAPPEPLLDNPVPTMTADSTGAMLGGDCEFLGFAYGGGWRAPMYDGKTLWLPFVKHCTISASDKDKGIWVLDGINTEGFSGGPVIFGTGVEQKILGVISGYHPEPAEVIYSIPAPTSPKASVEVNSGFIIAFDISAATDAIRKNPVGPLRKVQ
jgi:hypothetical protein